MTTPSNPMPESVESQRTTPAAVPETRPLYWSVRRELWENRSIYIAPLAVAAIGILGFLISLIHLPRTIRELGTMTPVHQHAMGPVNQHGTLAMPYAHVAWLVVLTAFIVGVFYSLDALYGERRDRSILFWKSLPVSDLTTVLSKASIPLVVLPLLVFAIILITELLMLLLSTAVLVISGVGTATLFEQLPWLQLQLVLLYSLIVMALWYAPIYGWLLFISGWARRTTFLWAVLPLVAITVLERIAFNSSHFAHLLVYRSIGWFMQAFTLDTHGGPPIDPHYLPLAQLTPGRFLSSPGLWVGLAVAAGFLAAAVRLRRYREPI
jgi:ABC-2 type transport system permease protein